MRLAYEGKQVVFAEAAELDLPQNDDFIVRLCERAAQMNGRILP
jgi:hypothetical protein